MTVSEVNPVATASASSSASAEQEVRPEAGPLPSKRGEIGYNEDIHGQTSSLSPEEPVTSLPERHPADRDAPPTINAPSPPVPSTSPSPTPGSTASSSTSSLVRRKRKLDFFRLKDKKIPSYGGLLLTTLLAFIIQCLLVGATIAGWALAIKVIMKDTKSGSSDSATNGSAPASSSAIFIHVIFGIAILGQLLFLERKLYRLRAERYAFKHPGEMLPTSRQRHLDPSIAFSPWNRPPLPTYAAALAQSGHGTGDVEDHIIAQPPPPAYGNTRGSVMILSGFINANLRAQRPVSERSDMTQNTDRPMSYHSQDEEWEVIQDADRALQLEETLARLERPVSRTH